MEPGAGQPALSELHCGADQLRQDDVSRERDDPRGDEEGIGEQDHHLELAGERERTAGQLRDGELRAVTRGEGGETSKGLFLSFEGVEGSGKSTQIARLAERLRAEGRDVLVVREPGGTPLAEEARRLVLDPAHRPGSEAELFLMLVARADLVRRVIVPALERGAVVMADRFDLSTRAYQIGGRGLPAPAVLAANALATGGWSRTW